MVTSKSERTRPLPSLSLYIANAPQGCFSGGPSNGTPQASYLWLYERAARQQWCPIPASVRMMAEETGLSKSAVQAAIVSLQRNELIATERANATAVPQHRVLWHWRAKARPRG